MRHAGSSLQHMGSFVVAHGLFIVAYRLLSNCGVQAPECTGSIVVVRGLSCPTTWGILVPQPEIEPMSPALEGGFLTTGPPGKSVSGQSSFKEIFCKVRKKVFYIYPHICHCQCSLFHCVDPDFHLVSVFFFPKDFLQHLL